MKLYFRPNLNKKVIGLTFLLIAWGADYFWRSNAEENLKKVEFITLNQGIVANNSELQFLKYIVQNSNDSKLLSLDYRNRLEAILATFSILKGTGIKPPVALQENAKELREFVDKAYQKGTSLEPKDIERDLRHEIIELEKEIQQHIVICLIKSREKLKCCNKIFIAMYIIGSILLIAGECNKITL